MTTRSPFTELFVVGCDILSATLSATGAILVQLGDAVNQTVESNNNEWWQHTGFRSMPAAPTAGAASCQQLAIRRNNHDMNFASKDERHATMWADLNPDEVEIFSFGGKCRVVCRASGSVELGTMNPTDFAALASLVKAELSAISTTLKSLTGQASFATPYAGPGNIASSTVKVST